MTDVVRANDGPIAVNVEKDQQYFWCACGRSRKQPFCDGSHKGTGISPIKYVASESRKVFFCACKATKKTPLCDGSHNDS
ncbi:MAG: CDGSH iron-sulfur domain-containing protein [Gammaproteobacteria bacterium]|nr:CDGSH iron-sulfur domain-containing protein [Gammaproteobacteria bacterium]NVK87166.1 CDGSH iron-sulfur domain-containing protein [Gammaproteobacteria bacterium]